MRPTRFIVGSNLTYSLVITTSAGCGRQRHRHGCPADSLFSFRPALVRDVDYEWRQPVHLCAGNINANGSATASLVVRPANSGNITNVATAASSTADPNSANNTATAVTTANVTPRQSLNSRSRRMSARRRGNILGRRNGRRLALVPVADEQCQPRQRRPLQRVTTSNLTVSGVEQLRPRNYRCVVSNQGGGTPPAPRRSPSATRHRRPSPVRRT